MELYLIRHAHALDAEDDAARPLSPRGRRQVRKLAAFLRQSEAFAPTAIWHSPLVRARDTASLLAAQLKLDAPLIATDGLTPAADPRYMEKQLRRVHASLALVGHEPHLGELASLLVTGRVEPVAFAFKKGSVLALRPTKSGWEARWQVYPELLGLKL